MSNNRKRDILMEVVILLVGIAASFVVSVLMITLLVRTAQWWGLL